MITKTEKRETWKLIEDLVIQHYSQIKDIPMRQTYYYLRDIFSQKIGKEITSEQFDYFSDNYNYYQTDKWPSWEKKYNIKRPLCKDPTMALYDSDLKALAYMDKEKFRFYRCQGFIFLEKSGFVNDLNLLSNNGWVILAGQGFSSREVREQIAESYPEKPILIVHDFDVAGNIMGDVFEFGSSRTRHLNLTFDNVIDIGLRKEDVEELNLPKEPESEKYRDKQKWRVELNALIVLKIRMKIDNPLLWYVTKRMEEEGIPLHREIQSSFIALKYAISYKVSLEIDSMIKEVIDNLLENLVDEDLVEVALPEDSETDLDDMRDLIGDISKYYLDGAQYIDIDEKRQNILYTTKNIKKSELKEIIRRVPQFESVVD